MSHMRVAAVTGANKGIGYAIVRNLALRYPSSKLNSGPLLLYLTSRDAGRGQQAVRDITEDLHVREARALSCDGGPTEVRFQQLDVNDEDSIERFEAVVNKGNPEGLDILVNNAGVSMDDLTPGSVQQTLCCNYYGTLSMTEGFLPLLKPGGRIVNLSSMLGKLNKYSPEITASFRSAANAESPAATTALMEQYHASVIAGTHSKDGWPSSPYAVSKAGVAAMTICIGQRDRRQNPGRNTCINACCPGYVITDMTKGRGRKSVDQGAQTPVMLALGDIGDVTGQFWEHEEVSRW